MNKTLFFLKVLYDGIRRLTEIKFPLKKKYQVESLVYYIFLISFAYLCLSKWCIFL